MRISAKYVHIVSGIVSASVLNSPASQTTLSLYSTIQECITDLQEEDPLVEESLAIAKHFFREITVRIRNKVRWPTDTLDPEDLASFEVYRRDAGEVMITA